MAVLAGLYIPRGNGSDFLTNLSHTSSLNMQTSASTRPTNRTLNTKLELQTVYLSDPSEAIRCINLASGRVDRVLIMSECSMVAPITENLVHSTAEYFLVRPMAKVLHEDNLHDFIQMAESVYEHGLPRCDIIHTSPYLKAGFSFETMKDPRILFIGAILYSLKVC